MERRQHGSGLWRQGMVVRLFRGRNAGQICSRGPREGYSIDRFLDRRARLQRCHEACSSRIFLSARGVREETGVCRYGLGGQGEPPWPWPGSRVAPVAREVVLESLREIADQGSSWRLV